MKKDSVITVVALTGIVALAGALLYFGGRSRPSASAPAAVDPHGHNLAASVSLSLLNNLVGKPAPDFSFLDRDGKVYSPDSLKGKNAVLFFNEGLMCYPACWNQIASLGEDSRFKTSGVVVLSVVADSKDDWQKAVDQMPELAEATVVFDRGAAISRKFGVLSAPSSMHPGSLPGHTYVVIDKEGVVRYVLDDPNMGIRNDELWAEVAKVAGSGSNPQ